MALSLSVWAQELIAHLNDHMDSERDALTAYGAMARSARDTRVAAIIRQILDDEVRHHQQFAEMRDDLQAELERRDRDRGRGRLDRGRRPDVSALLSKTEEMLSLERADIRELRRLARQLRKVEDAAWRAVIVEAMELDTRKHIRLLEGVRDLLREGSG